MNAGTTSLCGRPAPVMVLCRQCVRYVFEGTIACPHCGRDAREIGATYAAGNFLAIETMQRIDRLVEASAQERCYASPRNDRS
jgi:ribosomal protein L37E